MLTRMLPSRSLTGAIALCTLFIAGCQTPENINSDISPTVTAQPVANSSASTSSEAVSPEAVSPISNTVVEASGLSDPTTPELTPTTHSSAQSLPSREGEAVYTEYRNEKRSILVTSAEPWSGENGTGDFTFQRCDFNKEECDEVVTGGKADCNDLYCFINWDGIAQHNLRESRKDSEAIANYVFIWNYHHAAINEDMTRYGDAFFSQTQQVESTSPQPQAATPVVMDIASGNEKNKLEEDSTGGQKTITYYDGNGWDVMVAAFEPWFGEQNTGNFTIKAIQYVSGESIDLGDGKISCDSGACTTTWQDGNVSYAFIEETSLEDRFRNGPTETARLAIVAGNQTLEEIELQKERFPSP